MKNFTIAYKNHDNNYCEIYKYAERSDEAIKNGINNILLLKNNNHYIFRCTNESDLEWLYNNNNSSKKELYRNALTKEGRFILVEIKDHIAHILHFLKSYLKSALDP